MDKCRKIYLLVTGLFPSNESFRGSYIYDQAKAIERNSDYKVYVLKPIPFYKKEDDYVFGGIEVYCFTDYNLPSNIWPNSVTDTLSIKSMLNKLNKIGVKTSDIKVAHSHITRYGFFANALKKHNPNVVTIVQHHGFDVMSVTDGRLANFKWHERHCIKYGVRICNEVDLNIGVSRATLDYVEKQPGIKLRDSFVLYNGVDTTKFHRAETPNKRSDLFTIGCVANFWELKDQMTLIKAAERLQASGIRNLKVVFVGSGYTLAGCRQYVEDHSLSDIIEFRREVSHRELADFYRSLDLFVLPSYWEAFGCVYTEAYACGVPFIGVKGQGIAELIPDIDQNKFLIEKGDYEVLAAEITYWMDHREEKQTLTTSIDIDTLIIKYLEFIKSLLA